MAKKLKWDNSDEVVVKYAINDAHGNAIDVNSKVDKTTTVNGHALNANVTVTKGDVGLGSVANTGDSDTPAANGTDKFTTGGAYTLQQEIKNLKNIGRFLSIWNATTGVAETNPLESPYYYKTGDYFRIGTGGNRIPAGASYVIGGTNYTTTTILLELGDLVYYDGTVWQRQAKSQGGEVGDVQIDGTSIVVGGVANITKAGLGLGNVDNTSDATKKTNFTGSIANGNTGFVTGGDVYSALNLKADKTELPHLYKHTVVDNNNVEYIIIDNDNTEITTSTLLSHMLNAIKKMMSDPQNPTLPCCFDVICVFESTSKVVIYNGTTGVKFLTIAPTSLTDTITNYI